VRIGFDYIPRDMPLPDSGVVYEYFEENEKNRVLYCPKCKNYRVLSDDEFCRTCRTPLYNYCLREKRALSAECRRCPFCGEITAYGDLYDATDRGQKLPPPSCFSDFRVYEDWGYIRYLLMKKMGYSRGMYLFSVLSDSVVYTDSDRFILIFAGDYGHIQYLLNSLSIIEKHLETYAYVHVTEIYLYHYNRQLCKIFLIKPNT